MASSSVLLRLIHRKGFTGSSKWIGSCSPSSSVFKSSNNNWYHRRMCTSSSVISKPSSSKKSSSPWLMLPPDASELKFYSLAENRVINVSVEKEISDLLPYLDFKGSSHGWLALFNPRNLDLFLYNPISRRRVNLPPVHTLPNIPDENLKGGYGCVAKVIISCSPDDDPQQDCRAMIIYTWRSLAFCCPGKSKEWTPIGDIYGWDKINRWTVLRCYDDFVYSNAHKLFFCYTNDWNMESWDLRDPLSPKMTTMYKDDDHLLEYIREAKEEESSELEKPWCETMDHLVVDEQHNDLFLVSQNVMEHMAPDGSYVDSCDEGSEKCPHKTVDFDVFKYVPEEKDFEKMDGSSLGGLAIFTGFYTHSMALSATEFPELKPDSIYFTDPHQTPPKSIAINDDRCPFNGHDIGIFNYQDKTISPCYYPCDVRSFKKIVPSPMWFFPSPI